MVVIAVMVSTNALGVRASITFFFYESRRSELRRLHSINRKRRGFRAIRYQVNAHLLDTLAARLEKD